jgi:hypothetical protein
MAKNRFSIHALEFFSKQNQQKKKKREKKTRAIFFPLNSAYFESRLSNILSRK